MMLEWCEKKVSVGRRTHDGDDGGEELHGGWLLCRSVRCVGVFDLVLECERIGVKETRIVRGVEDV